MFQIVYSRNRVCCRPVVEGAVGVECENVIRCAYPKLIYDVATSLATRLGGFPSDVASRLP